MSEELLSIKDLTVSFPKHGGGKIQAVNDLSISVKKNEILGIIGESGSGKSVTIKNIMRLIKSPPECIESGDIIFDGKSIFSMSENDMDNLRGKDVSMIFQNPMSAFNPVLRIGRQIEESLEFHRPELPKKDRKKLVCEFLAEVGISHPERRINQYPHEFSGGMLQRAMIASALIMTPKLVLADEPTTGLDVTIQAQILSLIKNLQSKYGMSVIWITHDLSLLAGFANRIAIMYAGHVVEEGSREDIYYNALHPYTQGLLKSIPNINERKKLYSIEGVPPNPGALPPGCPFCERCPKAKAICKKEYPKKKQISDNHSVSCFLYEE